MLDDYNEVFHDLSNTQLELLEKLQSIAAMYFKFKTFELTKDFINQVELSFQPEVFFGSDNLQLKTIKRELNVEDVVKATVLELQKLIDIK